MRFTVSQYDEAIEALQNARQQILDNTADQGCSVCGGNCHPDSCGFNPLYAMHLCQQIKIQSNELHETLHTLSGYDSMMGETTGPAKIVMPGGGSSA